MTEIQLHDIKTLSQESMAALITALLEKLELRLFVYVPEKSTVPELALLTKEEADNLPPW